MKKIKFLGGMSAAFLATVALASCGPTKTYHVSFTNGNELVLEKDYKENEVIVAPEGTPEYKGEKKEHKTYTFDGWYENDFKFETGLKANKDYNFAAEFTEEDEVYHVYFKESEDDTEPDVQKLKFGDPIVVPEDLPDYKGEDYHLYEFKGWFDGETQLKEGDTCKGDETFTAKFEKGDLAEYEVNFYDYKGDLIDTDTGIYSEQVDIPSVPSYVDEEGYDWDFTIFSDKDGKTISDGVTFGVTLDHDYYAQYTKGDLHVYTAHVYKYSESDPTDFEYDMSIEGAKSWITVRQDILDCLPSDTTTDHYTFGELIPIAAPREYDEITYSVGKVDKYFETKAAIGTDNHYKFVDKGDTDAGWNSEMGKLEFTSNKGTAYLDTIVNDFALDFVTNSEDDNRLAIVLGADQDQLQTRSFVGGEGTGATTIDEGLIALSIMPESDTPFKLFYNGELHEGLTLINNWVKGSMAKGVAVHISMKNNILDITMNGIHLYQVDLSGYYNGGYIGFARGNAGVITSPVTHKFTGTFTVADGSNDKYFSHNYTTEAGLAGLSHGIDLVNRYQASVGRDADNKMIFNADTGSSYIQTVNAYDPDVHIKFKAQNIDDWATGAANDRFSIFFTDLAKQQKNYFQDNAKDSLGENGDFSVTPMVNGDSTAVKLCIKGTSTQQTILNKPTGKITDLKEYDLTIANGKCSLYIDGSKICEFDVPTATAGTKKYIGICGTKRWDIKELAIIENSDQVMYDYTQLPDGYGTGVGLGYDARTAGSTAKVSSGALTISNHNNGNLYTDGSFKDNFMFSLKYKSETSGRLMIVFGSTDPHNKGYSAGGNMGEGVVGLLINCPASGAGWVRLFDNSTTADTDAPIAEISGGAVSNYVEVTIMVISGTLYVGINDILCVAPVLTKQIAQTTGEGQICVTRGEGSICTFSFQHIAAGSVGIPE